MSTPDYKTTVVIIIVEIIAAKMFEHLCVVRHHEEVFLFAFFL